MFYEVQQGETIVWDPQKIIYGISDAVINHHSGLNPSNKVANIKDLEEGMIINKYYYEELDNSYKFDNEIEKENYQKDNISDNNLINEVLNILENYGISIEDLNLDFGKVNIEIIKGDSLVELGKNENNLGYIESSNGMGLTKEDLLIINYLFKKGYFKNPDFSIKRGIAFVPSLTLGYLIFILYGDLISIISNFLVNLL